jgi:hypothetical protein
MITQLSDSPTTSTPCQKLDVAKRHGVRRGLELAQQRRARRRALDQDRIVDLGARELWTWRRFA